MAIPTTIPTASIGGAPPSNCVDIPLFLIVIVGDIYAVEVAIRVECIHRGRWTFYHFIDIPRVLAISLPSPIIPPDRRRRRRGRQFQSHPPS